MLILLDRVLFFFSFFFFFLSVGRIFIIWYLLLFLVILVTWTVWFDFYMVRVYSIQENGRLYCKIGNKKHVHVSLSWNLGSVWLNFGSFLESISISKKIKMCFDILFGLFLDGLFWHILKILLKIDSKCLKNTVCLKSISK